MRLARSFVAALLIAACGQGKGSGQAAASTFGSDADGGGHGPAADGGASPAGRSADLAGVAGHESAGVAGLDRARDSAAVSGEGGLTAPASVSGAGGESGAAGAETLAAAGGRRGNVAGASAGSSAQDAAPYPAIGFTGLTSALELAPVRLAAGGLYPGTVSIGSGGVDNLFTSSAALLASNAETQALRASVQHPNLRIVFTICEGLYRIVAKRSAGIQALGDLRGKRIAFPVGTSSNYYVVKMLALAGMTEQDITVVNQMPGMGALNADAATIWEPGIQYVTDGLKDDAIEFQKDDQGAEVYRELFNLHATAESLSDPSKRRAIVRFVRALVDASAQIRADPTPVYALLTGPSGASQAVLQRSWPYERFAGGLVTDLLDVLEQEEVWRAQLDGRTARARADLAILIDDSVVKEASGP
jgi:sulfonate transport system substrate-binding protein